MSALKGLELFLAPPAGPVPHETKLELNVPPVASVEPTHKFTKIAHVIRPNDTLRIKLEKFGNTNAHSHIASYCCTQRDTNKIRVLSIEIESAVGGTTTVSPAPAAPYPTGTIAITFELNLENHELILIGIILEVTRPGINGPKHYLCDPQVGNGPP